MVAGNRVVTEEMRSSHVPDGFWRQDLLKGTEEKNGKWWEIISIPGFALDHLS